MYRLFSILFLIVFSTLAYPAVEDRCEGLGAACVCSEPVNTNSLVLDGGTEGLNPADTTNTEKECTINTYEGSAISALWSEIDQITTGNAAAVLAQIPENTISYYSRGVEGHLTNWDFGVKFIDNATYYDGAPYPTKRLASRYYVYHSSSSVGGDNDFQFKDDGACANSKWFKMTGFDSGIQSEGGINFTVGGGWSYNTGASSITNGNCCWVGPPAKNSENKQYANSPTGSDELNRWKPHLRGAWWRVETVITNRAGGQTSPDGFTLKQYMKNVTTNSPEFLMIDTTYFDSNVGPDNAWLGYDDLKRSGTVDSLYTNNYRQGTCEGYRAISHYMVATWSTDTGQRIGSALEIEGVSGVIDPSIASTPNPPSVIVQ